MTKYVEVLVAPDGNWTVGTDTDSLSYAVKNGKELLHNSPYQYWFVIKIQQEMSILTIKGKDLMKKKIVYAPDPFKFMEGLTVGRAIKKIVALRR